MSDFNILLANLIRIFHIGVVLFLILGAFVNIPSILIIHFMLCLTLIVHWVGNSNICSLSVLESQLRGLDYTESFTHKFIAPLYDVSQTQWITICYIIVITLMIISFVNLTKSDKWSELKGLCSKVNTNAPFFERIKQYIYCVKPLFYHR